MGRAFASIDRNGDGLLSAGDIEQLLCGNDGCEVRPARRGGAAIAAVHAQPRAARADAACPLLPLPQTWLRPSVPG